MPDFFWLLLRIGGYLAIVLVCLVAALTIGMIAFFAAAVINVWLTDRCSERAASQGDLTYKQALSDLSALEIDTLRRMYTRQEDAT